MSDTSAKISVISVVPKQKPTKRGAVGSADVEVAGTRLRCTIIRDEDDDFVVALPRGMTLPAELDYELEERVLAAYQQSQNKQKGKQMSNEGFKVTRLEPGEGTEFGPIRQNTFNGPLSQRKTGTTLPVVKPKQADRRPIAPANKADSPSVTAATPASSEPSYSGVKIEVSRMKRLQDKGALLASCTVTLDGRIKLPEVCLLSEYDEIRVIMPRRSIGKRMIPAVELDRALTADVRRAVLKQWNELQTQQL